MNEALAREEICRVGKSLFERGYVHATAGNISVRLDDADGGGQLITPTDACLGFLDPAALAKLDGSGQQISGLPASKTAVLHRAIYTAARAFDPETRSIIHTHSTHCVALTLGAAGPAGGTAGAPTDGDARAELLPALTPYFVMKVGHVPLIAYHRPGSATAAAEVVRAIEHYGAACTPIRAVMLTRLGPNVWHQSPAAAMAVLEELEETAKLWLLCGDAATRANTATLTPAQIDDLRASFAARW